MKAIILNSGIGSRLKEYTTNNPKSLVKIGENETIFSKAIKTLQKFDVEEYIITTGYKSQQLVKYAHINFPNQNFTFINNPLYNSTNYIKSLDYINDNITDDLLLLHGDLIFDKEVVEKVISNTESSVVVDSGIEIPEKDFKAKIQENYVKRISVNYFGKDALACQPLYKLNNKDWISWKNNIKKYCKNGNTGVYAEEALNELLDNQIKLKAVDINGYYCSEIDTVEDLENYKKSVGA